MKTVFSLFIFLFVWTANTTAVTGVPTSTNPSVDAEKVWTILVYEYEDKVHTSVVSRELDCSGFSSSSSTLNVVSCSHVEPKDLNSTLSKVTREYKSRLIPYSQAARELGLK